MKDQKIIKYLDYCIEKLNFQLSRDGLEPHVKNDIRSKIDTYRGLKETAEFQIKDSSEKQAFRIGWLASLRKRGESVDLQLLTIKLYEKINEIIPYIKTLNQNGKLNGLIAICERELDLIDYSHFSFGRNHVESNVFRKEMEKSLLKTNSEDMNPEAITRLTELKEIFEEVYQNQPA